MRLSLSQDIISWPSLLLFFIIDILNSSLLFFSLIFFHTYFLRHIFITTFTIFCRLLWFLFSSLLFTASQYFSLFSAFIYHALQSWIGTFLGVVLLLYSFFSSFLWWETTFSFRHWHSRDYISLIAIPDRLQSFEGCAFIHRTSCCRRCAAAVRRSFHWLHFDISRQRVLFSSAEAPPPLSSIFARQQRSSRYASSHSQPRLADASQLLRMPGWRLLRCWMARHGQPEILSHRGRGCTVSQCMLS